MVTQLTLSYGKGHALVPVPSRENDIKEQESLADAKVSARQQCVYEGP